MLQLLLWMVIMMVMMGEREQTDKVGSASWDENDGRELRLLRLCSSSPRMEASSCRGLVRSKTWEVN